MMVEQVKCLFEEKGRLARVFVPRGSDMIYNMQMGDDDGVSLVSMNVVDDSRALHENRYFSFFTMERSSETGVDFRVFLFVWIGIKSIVGIAL